MEAGNHFDGKVNKEGRQLTYQGGQYSPVMSEPIREYRSAMQPQVPPQLGPELLPKMGKVNEMCREWLVREDGALAYQLQSQEINQHYMGNKHRNAQVREDFPCALDEQIREQKLAEQAAAVYQKMLQEQEEVDIKIAKELADKIEREEQLKRRVLEMQDEDVARKILERERTKKIHQSPHKPISLPLQRENYSPHRPDQTNYFANLPRRAPQMPLPNPPDYQDLYTEPYQPDRLAEDLDRIDIQEVGLPIDEITERRIQEERDAELARLLQDQLSNSEESIMNRDRMLAMEAQDKELAKLLQERERAKAKRAKERAKQRAFAKKQQQEQMHQIMPDDSYSNPIDLLPARTLLHNIPRESRDPRDSTYREVMHEDDTNYSFPVDVIPNDQIGRPVNYFNDALEAEVPPPQRPTHLELRSPLTQKVYKPRFPDPDDVMSLTSVSSVPSIASVTSTASAGSMSSAASVKSSINSNSNQSPSKQHLNIAMAIDPTYPRRSNNMYQHNQMTPPSYDTTSSTVTTSTSTSSPGLLLPTPDLPEDDPSPVPPYMPIQGQRRTASLEKKSKRKAKDGCKQQ